MVNIWKVSTLVFAGAFAFVVGRGAIAESIACDGEEAFVPTAEQITRLRLSRGLAFLDRAEQEITAATAAPSRERTNALAQMARARSFIELALNPEPEFAAPPPAPRPKPMVIPRKRPVNTSTTSASTSPHIVNPFLRVSGPVQPVMHVVVQDPLTQRR